MTSVSPQRFDDQLILEVIDKGLNSLGESPKQAVWYYLEEKFKVSRAEVPNNVTELEEALQKIFGLGYNFLETLFRQYLKEATERDFNNSQSFAECVNSLKLELDLKLER